MFKYINVPIVFFLIVLNLSSKLFADDINIKWGLALPLSGPVAKAGIDIQRGFKLAVSEINKKSKFKHVLFFEDTQFIAKNAVSAATKLITVNNVDIIVSLWDTADPIAPITERYKVLHTPIRWNSDIAHKYEYTFTFESTYKDYAKKFTQLFKKIGIKKIAMLSMETSSWLLARDAFIENFKKENLKLVFDLTYSNNPDYKLLALKSLSKKPDIIIINDSSESMNLFTKKARTFNPSVKITGYLGYPMDLNFYNNTYFIDQLSLDKSFAKKFKKIYGEAVYVRAQLAYDLSKIVSSVYEKFNSKASTKEIVNGLKEVKSYKGASGIISKSADGKVFKTTSVCRYIEEGKITDCKF